MCFIKRSDPGRYKVLLDQLQQSSYLGRDEYPINIVNVYDTLIRYSSQFTLTRPRNRNLTNGGRERNARYRNVNFTQASNTTPVPGRDGILHDRITCYNFNTKRHYADQCPNSDNRPGRPAVGVLQISVALAQKHDTEADPATT